MESDEHNIPGDTRIESATIKAPSTDGAGTATNLAEASRAASRTPQPMGAAEEVDTPSGRGDESDVSVPKATVYKIISEMLPAGIQCPSETRDFIIDCCTEFIHLISSEANEVCERVGRKTIMPEHVVEALKNLGFASYVDEVMAVYEEACEQAKEKASTRGGNKLENSGLTEEELLRQQEELFEQARRKFLASSNNEGNSPSEINNLKET